MVPKFIIIRAEWDEDAQVWVATSDDIGFVTEAESLEALRAKAPIIIADLLEGVATTQDIPIEIVAHSSTRVRLDKAAA